MTEDEKQERKRLIIKRRLLGVAEEFSLPPMGRQDLYRLSTMIVTVLGEDGVPAVELRTLYKLTTRGLLRTLRQSGLRN